MKQVLSVLSFSVILLILPLALAPASEARMYVNSVGNACAKGANVRYAVFTKGKIYATTIGGRAASKARRGQSRWRTSFRYGTGRVAALVHSGQEIKLRVEARYGRSVYVRTVKFRVRRC